MNHSVSKLSSGVTDVSFAALLEEIANKCLAREPVDLPVFWFFI